MMGGHFDMTLQRLGPDFPSPLFHHSKGSDNTGIQHKLYDLVL
jgi:hypothetical protein